MHEPQKSVEAFHRAKGVTIGDRPAIRDAALRAALIREEAAEAVTAIEDGDLVAAIDGLCDLLYVAYGTAVAFGIDLEPFFEEVHRSNMTKASHNKRDDGKIMKGVEWEPPRLANLLVQDSQEVRAR
jgi:predicted HAD superfamily Cof-like phosphohydrolase